MLHMCLFFSFALIMDLKGDGESFYVCITPYQAEHWSVPRISRHFLDINKY